MAVAGLLVLVTSQFRDQEFSAGSTSLTVSGYDYHPLEAAIGSLFRIKYPDDWTDEELYEFDWTVLKSQGDRFQKIDFNAIPS
ncbi:hypothetical protein GCM10007385_00930 [Tateyamaria omphalii]|uniref:hypothetical protein n=1 Tax=Tateyamaria omphalii TaxID=299262 RepID=UPI00167392CA|nr:hypothetical protein [Tateyamaria omphalii]GGX37984.1 hypothetical protein GCM10007385_00930 [Tateyamaria omphalii]